MDCFDRISLLCDFHGWDHKDLICNDLKIKKSVFQSWRSRKRNPNWGLRCVLAANLNVREEFLAGKQPFTEWEWIWKHKGKVLDHYIFERGYSKEELAEFHS